MNRAVIVLAAAIQLIEVHGPDGQVAYVAAGAIASLREPTSADLARHFASKVRCVVVTTDGKFLAVTETCRQLRDKLNAGRHE